MPIKDSFGPPMAEKLYLEGNYWLAQYVLKKFRSHALTNPSLPRSLVDEAVQQSSISPREMWCIAQAHVFDSQQYEIAARILAPAGCATALLIRQAPPTLRGLEVLLELDTTIGVATCAISHAVWSRFVELPTKTQREVLKRVIPDLREEWSIKSRASRAHQAPKLQSTQGHRDRWFKESKTYRLSTFAHWSVPFFSDTLSKKYALPKEFTAYLAENLGESETTWDAFFSLAENWDTNFEELVATAKNLS